MEPTPDKVKSATLTQMAQTTSLYAAACTVISSLALGDTHTLKTLSITKREKCYLVEWLTYNPAYHAAFVTAIAVTHTGYTRQEWLDANLLKIEHGLVLEGWQSVTSNTQLEERVERKVANRKKKYGRK